MAKPIIKSIIPIDANSAFEVSAQYTGTLPYSNKVIIYNADTLAVVYQHTEVTHFISPAQTIPANTLMNDKRYAITIQFFDGNNVGSAVSDKEYFLTLSTPTFTLSDGATPITGDLTTIGSSSISATINYTQIEGEPLYSFKFYLYDVNKALLSQSSEMYDYANVNSYIFKGLENRTTYYLRCEGVTNKGIHCDTGLKKIFTNFENPASYAKIYAESDGNGTINGYTNILMIEPDDPDISNYDFGGGFVELFNRDVCYSTNFNIYGDFTLSIKTKNCAVNSTIMKLKTPESTIILDNYVYNDDNNLVYKLTVPNALCNYVLYATTDINNNLISTEYGDTVTIHIRRINNVYEMYIIVNENTESQENMWFGISKPISGLNINDIYINTLNSPTIKVNGNDVAIYYQNAEPETGEQSTVVTPTGTKTKIAQLESYQVWIGDDEEVNI